MSRLEIDRRARTIYGRAIPWNVVALINRTRVEVRENSLTWPERVNLVLRHDNSLIVGQVISIEPFSDGLYAFFSVRRGPRGEQAFALAKAGWGFSCSFDLLEYTDDSDATYCTRGEITEISLVPNPAFP